VAHGDGERRSQTVQRVERQRERAEGLNPRESGETERELRLDGDECRSVGDWEWRHDGGTLAGSGLHGRLGSSHAWGGGVCEWSVGSVSVSLLLLFLFCY
jgi:hypothetical protein